MVQDAVGFHKEGQELESLCAEAAPGRTVLEKEVIAAAAVAAAADGFVPYNVEPIPGWHSGGYHPPYQQKPRGSCRVEFRHSKT
jgi:hypothetical protein